MNVRPRGRRARLAAVLALGLLAGGLPASSAAGSPTALTTTAPASTTPTANEPTAPPSTDTTDTTTPSEAPSASPTKKPAPPSPTRLTALPPSTLVDGTAPLRIRLSGAPAANSPRPMLTPAVAGTWSTQGDWELFTPTSTLEPCSSYTLTIWSATSATGQASLGRRRTLPLTMACPGVRALQQALARLGYLPYALHSAYGVRTPAGAETRALAARRAFEPPVGGMHATVRDAPSLAYGTLDATTRGAVMVFQAAHGIDVTGSPEKATWTALLASETLNHRDRSPYTFVTVSESSPETLEVHEGNHVAISSPANTGVAGASTPQGTFPIFARYTATTMAGTNPDGTHYDDPGVPWVNYFNGGDAVHGFERASYGSPQSNGCVELPIATAHSVYRLLAIGDIVVVNG